MKIKNYLLGYQNMYIMQDTKMFNFSLDSVLLPNFVTLNKNIEKVMDIGCGNAPIPLILSTRTQAKIIGIEIQKDVYELGKESIEINNLNNQIEIINADINEYFKELPSDSFDVITCNPPYFKIEKQSNLNNNDYKSLARHEIKLNINDIMRVSRKLLKNNGIIAIVHRPERIVDIITAMRHHNIEPKKVQFVYPKKDQEANILLIEGRKNGNVGLKILPPLYSHDENGNYTEEIQQFFKNRN